MNLYTLYIEDDRYRVPTLMTAELADDETALAYVSTLLSSSSHYLSVEIWEGSRQLPHTLRADRAESGGTGNNGQASTGER
jgi:hypothetical protein